MTRLDHLNNAWYDYANKHGKPNSYTNLLGLMLCSVKHGRATRFFIECYSTGKITEKFTAHGLTVLLINSLEKGDLFDDKVI